jgi:AcrR family transcriptional regulator
MARTQSKNYPEIRESILKSAAKLFAAKGYPNTSIVDLADACNSSRGALYHYFDSKEQILFEILNTHLDAVLDALNAVDSGSQDPLPNLRALLRRLMVLNSENQSEQITLLNAMNQLDEAAMAKIADKQRDIVDLIVDALGRLDAQKRMNARSRKAYAMMILGALNYTYIWYDPKGPITPEAYADMTCDTFVRGFINQASGANGEVAGATPRRRHQIKNEIV